MSVEASEAEIYLRVGQCLAQWSRVEFALAALFCLLNDRRARANDPLYASFEIIKSLEVKQAMLRALIESDPRTEGLFRERYRALDNKLTRMARRRAEVAHFSIVHHHDAQSPAGRAMLHPFHTFTGMFFETNKRPLSGAEVKTRADGFRGLADRVFRFVIYTQNVRGLLERHDAPLADPDRLLDNPYLRKPTMFVSLPE